MFEKDDLCERIEAEMQKTTLMNVENYLESAVRARSK